MTAVVWITDRAVRPMAWSPHDEWRLIMRVYLEVVLTIIGLLGAFVALTHLAA
jgi:hypothetical protein